MAFVQIANLKRKNIFKIIQIRLKFFEIMKVRDLKTEGKFVAFKLFIISKVMYLPMIKIVT